MSIFISYAHVDKEWLTKLRTHLRPLERITDVTVFADTDIKADEKWREKIRQEIESATFGILLISANFLASDFINDHELPLLFEQRAKGRKKLFLIFLSPCAFELVPQIADYQGYNSPSEPLSSQSADTVDKIFADLTIQISKEIKKPQILTSQPANSAFSQLKEDYDPVEIDYALAKSKRVFSDVSIFLPRFLLESGLAELDGFSFENCRIYGPAVIYAPFCMLTNNSLGAPQNDIDALFLTPNSKNWIVGAIQMSHLRLNKCRLQKISFVENDGTIRNALGNPQIFSDT
jgi:hypothetical protein